MAKVATKFIYQDGLECQKYHDTIVTRMGEDERGLFVQCFTGGWLTKTTKDRINDVATYLGWKVAQVRGKWFAYRLSDWLEVPFCEGITLFADGTFNR